MNFGKSKAKIANPDSQKITFKEVAGADEEKAELEEIVDFLKMPAKYIEMGATRIGTSCGKKIVGHCCCDDCCCEDK